MVWRSFPGMVAPGNVESRYFKSSINTVFDLLE